VKRPGMGLLNRVIISGLIEKVGQKGVFLLVTGSNKSKKARYYFQIFN
jgi:hypothetical protein